MWFIGNIYLNRSRSFIWDSFNQKKRTEWKEESPYGTPLEVDPFVFIHALIRTSLIGSSMSIRQRVTCIASAISTLANIEKFASTESIHLHKDFSKYKDFIGTSYKGIIGAALAYLEMTDSGYSWVGHWEDCISPNPETSIKVHPDFVFANGSHVCIADAKGTSSASVDTKVKAEWKRQVLPNLGSSLIMGGKVNKGVVIATTLMHGTASKLLKTEGEIAKPVSSVTTEHEEDNESATSTVQRACIVDILEMVGETRLAQALMSGHESLNARGEALNFQLHVHSRIFAEYQFPVMIDSEVWIVRPFCNPRTVHQALEKFVVHDDKRAISLNRQCEKIQKRRINTKDEEITMYIVESPDGFGTLFKKHNKMSEMIFDF